MPRDLISWILGSWISTKELYEKEGDVKSILILSRILRSFINQTRDKRAGISQENKTRGQGMVDYLSDQIHKFEHTPENHSILFAALQNVHFSTRHLGVTAIQGSALKRKLTPKERAGVRKLAKPARRRTQPKYVANDGALNNSSPVSMGDGRAETA
jgi:hypothetical protein